MNKQKIGKGLIVQFVLLIILIILMFLSFVWKDLLPYADLLAGTTSLVMAYNKKDELKKGKKYIPIILIVLGILFIFLGIFNFING